MSEAELEQALRDEVKAAMHRRDPRALGKASRELRAIGVNPRIVADNVLLDLDEETLAWWLKLQDRWRMASSVEEAIAEINEAARG